MPYLTLHNSPLVPGISPVEIYYRETAQQQVEQAGTASKDEVLGSPDSANEQESLLFLHGGWGYEMYPFTRQMAALREHYKMLAPDRGGYGRSTRLVDALPSNFHYHAAAETLSFMDSLGMDSAFFWGHSDGAVIAAILGFTAPERVNGLILEAFHYYSLKPASRKFFEALANEPEALGKELCEKFANTIGADYWRDLITTHAKAWLLLAKESAGPTDDLYHGRLSELTVPTMIIHGQLDPRTEPGELDDVRQQLPRAKMEILDNGSHSPHTEAATADIVTGIATRFLAEIRSGPQDSSGPK